MTIKHFPITDTNKIINHFSKKDGVDIGYVCTTDLLNSDFPIDIFYRSTPHPKFGNRYFGIYFSGHVPMICNADDVEGMTFGMVINDDGDLEYSRSHHEYKGFENGNMIDGGRSYIRSSPNAKIYTVRNGQMVLRNTNE